MTMATVNTIAYFCLPNIRCPFVAVYEPHPWDHGALRVKEESAVLLHRRSATTAESRFVASDVRHLCITFATEAAMIAYESGQVDPADLVESCGHCRRRIDEVLARVAKRRTAKAKRERAKRRMVPLPLASGDEQPGVDIEIAAVAAGEGA